MPTISVPRKVLLKLLGRDYTDNTDKEIEALCFDYGLELEEVTTERKQAEREKGVAASEHMHSGAADEWIYKIEVPANRYDLLCVEGLAQNLLIFGGQRRLPLYQAIEPMDGGPRQRLIVLPDTARIRKFCVAAILRNITFTKERYASFIDLQDKLHQNLCRKRTLVAIGTHDLDTVQGPFTYDAKKPKEIKFRALNQQEEHTAEELMEIYSKDSHLKPYLPIIRDSPVYPVIFDRNGVVLSMPPIINGEHSKITLNTRHVFIECTATDLQKARIVLDTIVTMFSPYCEGPHQNCVEKVDVEPEQKYDDGKPWQLLQHDEKRVRPNAIRECIGVSSAKLSDATVIDSLNRMGLESNKSDESGDITVNIPPTRHDILHACDIVEDVAVAYGFNKIPRYLPESATIAQQFDLNSLCEKLRQEIVAAGYSEALSFTLCSEADISVNMRKKLTDQPAVKILNPKSADFQVARTTLIPGLLKTLANNKNMPLPLKLFEVSDILLADKTAEVGARNRRHLCAVYYGKTSGFEVIHGLLDHVMMVNEVVWSGRDAAAQGDSKKPTSATVQNTYLIEPHDDASFLPGRCAQILLKTSKSGKKSETEGRALGLFGVLHPEVLSAFELSNPVSVLEIDVENFLPLSEDI